MLEVLLGLRRDIPNSSLSLEFDNELPGCAHPATIVQSAAVEEGMLRKPQPGLHRAFQFPGRPERNLFARLDLDGLSGRRVPSHPCCTLPHLEDAEAGQTDFVAPLQMTGGQRHQIAKHGLRLLLRDLVAVGQRGGEVLECDSRLDGRFGWGCFLLSRHQPDRPSPRPE